MAGWYRKKYLVKRFGANEEDLTSVLELYKNLNINPILDKLYNSLIKENNVGKSLLRESGGTFSINKKSKMSDEEKTI